MNKKRKIILIKYLGLFTFFAQLIFISCSNDSSANKEIKIGLLKDPSQSWMEPGAKFAVKVVNDSGGVLIGGTRIPIKLYVEEMKTLEAEDVVSSMLRLINQDSVTAIFGPLYSKQTLPASRIAENLKVPLLSSYSTHPAITLNKKYVFRLAFTNNFQAEQLAIFTVKDLKHKRFAVLYEVSDDYCRNLAVTFKQKVEHLGAKVVGMETYTFDGNKDFEKLILNLKQKNIDVLFLPNYLNDFVKQCMLLKKLNMDITIIGGDAANNYLDTNRIMPDYYTIDRIPTDTKSITDFRNLYLHVMNKELEDTSYADSYDGLNVLIESIRRAQKYDSYSIMKSLNNFAPYKGVSSIFEYRNSGDPLIGVSISKYSNGKMRIQKICKPIQ